MTKVFDIHTHTYPEAIAEKACINLGKFYDFIVEGEGTYAHLESQAAENNVGGYLLFSVCTNAHQVQKVNSSIASLAELSRSHGFKTVGYAGMHQDYPDFRGELERCRELGLRGVKIHPDIQGVDINDPRLMPLYEIMEEMDFPLYLHMGDNRPEYRFSEAKKLAEVLERFPKLRAVAAHLGGYKSWEDGIRYLAGRKNVMYDTSSALWAMTPETAFDIIHKLGTENIMFGTDYPVKNTREELVRFHAIGLTPGEEDAILWHNAVRFLGIEE